MQTALAFQEVGPWLALRCLLSLGQVHNEVKASGIQDCCFSAAGYKTHKVSLSDSCGLRQEKFLSSLLETKFAEIKDTFPQ